MTLREKLDRLRSETMAAITAKVSECGLLEFDTRPHFTMPFGTMDRYATALDFQNPILYVTHETNTGRQSAIHDFEKEVMPHLSTEALLSIYEACVEELDEAPASGV